jgi:orotidine-5'-phosphate decarboxylase
MEKRWPDTLRRGTIRYMAVVGERVQISSRKVGEAPRDGVVTGVTGSLLRVRWSTGEESTVVPSMGSLAVVGKTRLQSGGDDRRRQTTSASATKGQVGTRAVPRRVAASKRVTKAVKESGQATRSQTAQKAAKVAAQPKKASKLPR